MSESERHYCSLESAENRQNLVAEIKKVRQEVMRLVEIVPKDKWYDARYHGWSLAALLAHLQLMDNLTLKMMQAALRGLMLPMPRAALNLFNNITAKRLLKTHDVTLTLHDMQTNEMRLVAFVLKLLPDKSQRKVYDPWLERYLTVEEAVQEFFLIHWQHHLATVRQADDKGFYEPTVIETHTV